MTREEIKYEPSIYDDMYNELTGEYLSKEGAAYERLSTAVIGILQQKGVSHDMKIRGRSGSIYQIDGLVEKIIMIEAKDYAKRNSKVPRSDLQKQEGALIDLQDVKEGYFASATGYTKPAQKYAVGTKSNDLAKVITAFNIRKITEADKTGRIQTIAVKIDAAYPEFRPDSFRIIWYNQQVESTFMTKLQTQGGSKAGFSFSQLYDDNGQQVTTIQELSRNQQPRFKDDDKEVKGQFTIDANILAFGQLFKIKGISYVADIIHILSDFEVKKKGNVLMLAKCDDLDIDTLLTDVEIKDALAKL